jgi:uncharacterized protein (DUF58 family)
MKWYLAAGLLLLAAFFLESSLLAYATYVLLGALVVSRVLARNWIANLTATRQCDITAAEIGDKVPVTLTLRNTGSLPVPWVLAEDLLPQSALSERPPRLRVKGKRLLLAFIRGGQEATLRYTLECRQRGYYQIGPVVLESGDVFGLHRRFRVETTPHFLLVLPRVVPLEGYELASRRPIGEVVLTHRLFEDPTRIAGVRPYEPGDALNRVHWRATARTGQLHSKVYEPTTLAGATVLLDFHEETYLHSGIRQNAGGTVPVHPDDADRNPGEVRANPESSYRSELAVTAAVSLANAVFEMGQQVGLVTNARDAADRIRREGWHPSPLSPLGRGTEGEGRSRAPNSNQAEASSNVAAEEASSPTTRQAARESGAMQEKSDRLDPIIVETRRGAEQLQRIRETLGRVELTDGITFAGLVLETSGRLPRDATVVAVLGTVTVDTAVALGNLHRQGFALTAVLIALTGNTLEKAHGRLLAEGIRDVRHLPTEAGLPTLCQQQVMGRGQFASAVEVAAATDEPDWMRQTPYELDSPED